MTPNGYDIFNYTKNFISGNIVYLLPRNSDSWQLLELAGPGEGVEFEENFINKRIKTVTAYYGCLINHPEIS